MTTLVSSGAALFMEMGTGKSKTIIDTTDVMYFNGVLSRALIIVPLSIVDTWGRELEKHSSSDHAAWFPLVGKGRKDQMAALSCAPQHKLKWGIINIEGLETLRPELEKYKPEIVIIDESTVVKTRTAKRTKLVIEMFSNAPYKIIASGNPIPKSPEEIFAQYKFTDPGVYGEAFYPFRDRYFDLDYFNKVRGFKAGMESVFSKKFHSIAVVKRKQDCLSLPPKVYEVRTIEMAPEQAKFYKEMKKDALTAYNDELCTATVVITKVLRLSQIAGGVFPAESGTLYDITPNPKLDSLMEVIEELPHDEQVVVWARFQREIELIEERLKKGGHSCVTFYGETKYQDRLTAKQDFLDKKIRIFIANPATGGRGLNELIGATTVIYYSNDYSAENRQQSEDRNHRNGTIKVTYIDLVMKGTIDEGVLSVLRQNKDVSDFILTRSIIL